MKVIMKNGQVHYVFNITRSNGLLILTLVEHEVISIEASEVEIIKVV